jgi:hypothetical protein
MKANRRRRASAASLCRLTPCTRSVQPRAGSALKSARRNGPCAQRVAAARAHDEARFHVVASGKRDQRIAGEDPPEIREGGAHEEGFPLPESGEKRSRRGAAEDRDVAIAARLASRYNAAETNSEPAMNIFANTAVTINFKLFDANNKLIEESPDPLVYLHGGHSGIFPKIEEALNFKEIGDSISVTLEPEDAFGDYDEKMVRMENVSDLPPDVTVGGYLVASRTARRSCGG